MSVIGVKYEPHNRSVGYERREGVNPHHAKIV